jgi:hypothetical protein
MDIVVIGMRKTTLHSRQTISLYSHDLFFFLWPYCCTNTFRLLEASLYIPLYLTVCIFLTAFPISAAPQVSLTNKETPAQLPRRRLVIFFSSAQRAPLCLLFSEELQLHSFSASFFSLFFLQNCN